MTGPFFPRCLILSTYVRSKGQWDNDRQQDQAGSHSENSQGTGDKGIGIGLRGDMYRTPSVKHEQNLVMVSSMDRREALKG